MFVKCEKSLLLENINLVQKAVSNRTSLPILECFLLVCDDKGFRMISSDLEIGIKTNEIECEIVKEGAVALPSKFFSDIIRKLPDSLVTIEVKENSITVIKCLNSEFKIVGRNADEFPALPEIDKDKQFTIIQSIFKSLIRQTIFSICLDESKPNLMGSLIELDKDNIKMVTCDTFRVSYRHDVGVLSDLTSKENVTVPAKAINELYKLITKEDSEMSVFITSKHIMFDIGSCTIISRLIDGEFINYSNIFSEDFETRVTVEKNNFLDALERASLVSYQENKKNPVKINIDERAMIITTNTELGNSYDEIEIDIHGKGIDIAFNPKFLIEAVKCVDEEKLYIEFNTPLSPCVIRPVAEDNYKCLILPLRLKN